MYHLSEVKIEVTYRCPLACVHCSSDAHEDNSLEMSYEKCLELLMAAKSLGVNDVSFSGGEPLIWPAIVRAVEAAAPTRVTIYTSGNVPERRLLFSHLARAGLNRLVFSLYSADGGEHDRVTRKRGSHEGTLQAMEEAKALGIATEVHFVAMACNYRRLNQVARLSKEHGAERVSILRFVPQGRGTTIKGSQVLSRQQNQDLAGDIRALRADGYSIRTGSPFNFLFLNTDPKCSAGQDRLTVAPDLRVYPCDAFKQIRAEDIAKTSDYSVLDDTGLAECWQYSPYLIAVRRAVASGYGMVCGNCKSLSNCMSGCLAQRFLAFGSLSPRPDPDCILHHGRASP